MPGIRFYPQHRTRRDIVQAHKPMQLLRRRGNSVRPVGHIQRFAARQHEMFDSFGVAIAVRAHFQNGVIIGNNDAVKTPFLPQNAFDKLFIPPEGYHSMH